MRAIIEVTVKDKFVSIKFLRASIVLSPRFLRKVYHRKEVKSMANDVLGMVVSKDEQEEIKEFVATLLLLPKEDRAVLLSNANAFKVRRDIEKAKEAGV